MNIHLQRDLEHLQRRILALASSVEQAVGRAIRALFERDAELARSLMEGEAAIDLEETLIEEECLKILALHQPVAGDLRRVAAILKINTDLERMADLASNIAERVSELNQGPPVPIPSGFQVMADLTNSMVGDSLDAFVKLDLELAKRVCRLDDEVDRHNREIIAQVIKYMKKSAENVEPGLNLFSVSRQLERIADHATNIAEDVVYLISGEIIRHHPEALEAGNVK
ncbi:MAG: phosphate signaling complex protein PhoU [Gemmatales bacterium]|nr:phosphate signaling complex protein PhoU [Gemmatales bacterium]MDW8387315.1 phosphate signaling complex protein PhoU [Gemmatales bacterium]